MEEVEGFEPRATLAACRFSRPIPSAELGYTSMKEKYFIIYVKTILKENGGGRGFEPPRDSHRLSVFKTDPFSRTWVYLRDI